MMTEYEYFKNHLYELADKVSEIHDICERFGFDFSKSLEDFMRSRHKEPTEATASTDTVERQHDTTFVVNVAFVYNTHDAVTDDSWNYDIYKNSVVVATNKLLKSAFFVTSLDNKPDDYSITNVQLFQFDE